MITFFHLCPPVRCVHVYLSIYMLGGTFFKKFLLAIYILFPWVMFLCHVLLLVCSYIYLLVYKYSCVIMETRHFSQFGIHLYSVNKMYACTCVPVCARVPHCTAASDWGVVKLNQFFMASGFCVWFKSMVSRCVLSTHWVLQSRALWQKCDTHKGLRFMSSLFFEKGTQVLKLTSWKECVPQSRPSLCQGSNLLQPTGVSWDWTPFFHVSQQKKELLPVMGSGQM